MARAYALGLGIVYVAVAIWGFIIGSGDSILSIVPVNTEDNVLHLLIGIAGVGAYLASRGNPTTGPIFATRTGKPMDNSGLRKLLRRLCLLAGLAALYPPFLASRHRDRLVMPADDALAGAVALARSAFSEQREVAE